MDFFITATLNKTDGLEAHRAEEDRVLSQLRAEGVVSAAYRRTDGQGAVGIVHGADLADVQAQVLRLPFVAHGFMSFDYAEVVPL